MGIHAEAELAPTLWRTCRALANRVRLRMLHVLFREGELPVSAVADEVGVGAMLASQYLRVLGARGFLAARRDGRWVYYRPVADPAVQGAGELLDALRATFSTERRPVEKVYRAATAFTHPRRLRVVQALADSPGDIRALARRTRISRFALRRHLDKLARRGVVKRARGVWRLVRPRRRLDAALLACALREGRGAAAKGPCAPCKVCTGAGELLRGHRPGGA